MSGTMNRLDANEQAFFKRQTEYIKSKTYDKKYRMLKAKQFIPVSTEVPSGSQFVTWRSFSKYQLPVMGFKVVSNIGVFPYLMPVSASSNGI